MPKPNDKSFAIPKQLVWEAWRQVRANKGAPGVDGQALEEFESDLENELYRIWNRMSSGTWFPPPVRAVVIPAGDRGEPVWILTFAAEAADRGGGGAGGVRATPADGGVDAFRGVLQATVNGCLGALGDVEYASGDRAPDRLRLIGIAAADRAVEVVGEVVGAAADKQRCVFDRSKIGQRPRGWVGFQWSWARSLLLRVRGGCAGPGVVIPGAMRWRGLGLSAEYGGWSVAVQGVLGLEPCGE